MAKSKIKTVFVCQNCGAQRSRYEGKCSDCGSWNSFVEETSVPETPAARGWSVKESSSKPLSLDQSAEEVQLKRLSTNMEELNRVLGGGLAEGSFALLGGSPGIGKSTLLLQMAGGLSQNQHRVLYVSAEESVSQTASRAHRLGIRSALIQVVSESNLNTIIDLARKIKPDVLIVDSIQTVFLSELQAAPGSVSQVRECAGHLMTLAKQDGMSVMLVGHVTKDGTIAGPKVLEHMVDTVLSFEGDGYSNYRLLRSIKNRFGAAQELGVFHMAGIGLVEVSNPSELFLQERGDNLIGSSIFASMEGTRPVLCEVQALTMSSPMSMPRRNSLGVDVQRLHMLTAVLDRHLDIRLGNSDVFINVVGGLKLIEPASDIPVAAAMLSTEKRKPLGASMCFFGELGLTGEVRGVPFFENRIREGIKLGFKHFVLPEVHRKQVQSLKLGSSMEPLYLKRIQDLADLIL